MEGVLIFSGLIFGVILLIAFYLWRQRVGNLRMAMSHLFREFGLKMWMTVGIGVLFFGFYALLIFLSSFAFDQEARKKIFIFVYQHPVESVYFGLFTFACTTLSIYAARMFIKSICNR